MSQENSSFVKKVPTPVSKAPVSHKSEVSAILRAEAAKEREFEEKRLRDREARRARQSGETATPRQGSIVPGTPGSVAPDPVEKAPTKKEQRKKAELKTSEANNHAMANSTTAQFLGGGAGLFGKKKQYSWMTNSGTTGGSSGSSTPGRIRTQGLTPGVPVNAAPERLTSDGARRLGTWRENHPKGDGIQIRDWMVVLEDDGREARALQKLYANLD
jgi:hypothetical protein